MNHWRDKFTDLKDNPRTWLVTGVSGFIGSNLLENLLLLNQKVVGLDNFSMGFQHNLDLVRVSVSPETFDENFTFHEGDIRNMDDCLKACAGVDYVLHQAAVGSVPKSIEDPLRTHTNNVDGCVNMLIAAKDSFVKSFVYASSSSVYGDTKVLPQVEEHLGNLLSPYAASKRTNELFAQAFSNCYDISVVGLRYFNVFGPRQNHEGAYAAVIPKWINNMIQKEVCTINGDGTIYRDFTYVENVVLANMLAATSEGQAGEVFNAALGGATTLMELHELIKENLHKLTGKESLPAHHGQQRKGDILTSMSDSSKLQNRMGFECVVNLQDGIEKTVSWYVSD